MVSPDTFWAKLVCVVCVICGCVWGGGLMCRCFDNCVGVLVICVLVFTVFCVVCTVFLCIVSFMCIYFYLFSLY